MKACVALAGLVLAGWAGISSAASSPPRQEKEEKDCPLCLEQARIKKEFEAGRMAKLEWIDRRLALLEGEYYTNRLGLLEEKEKAQEPEYKAGKSTLGDVLDTKLEIAWLRLTLKKTEEKEFRKRRQELVGAYKNWLKEQLDGGKIGKEDYQKKLERLDEEP